MDSTWWIRCKPVSLPSSSSALCSDFNTSLVTLITKELNQVFVSFSAMPEKHNFDLFSNYLLTMPSGEVGQPVVYVKLNF
jgi:hypothetical protein